MRITYCITRLDEIGGAQTHLRDIAIHFSKQGHEISVITGPIGDIAKELQLHGITVHSTPYLRRNISPLHDALALYSITKLLRKLRPNVVACHSSKAGIIGRLAAWMCQIPSVFTVHGWAFTEGVPTRTANIYKLIERYMAKITSHIITVSEYDKNLALKNNVAKNEDMTVIHNCIDDHITNTRPPANKSGPVRLLMVARFGVPKDHSLLLKALKECRDLNWELYLVGGGDHTKYRSLCSEYRLEDRVYFLGQRQDVASIMNESDIFLLISKWEGFPISIVEAMRAGLPVIASNVGGVSESVTEGQTGFLTPRDNADILIDRIRSLITDKDLCIQMGTQGYKDFQDKFTLQKMTEKTLHVYETYSN